MSPAPSSWPTNNPLSSAIYLFTYGLTKNEFYTELVNQEVVLNDFFS